MDSGGCLLVLLLLVFIQHQNNRTLAAFQGRAELSCPRIRVKCLFKEISFCSSDKDCKAQEKCCLFSCGMKCLDITKDPCEDSIKTRYCPHTLTRWYFNIKENECFPTEYSLCTQSKNNFQSHNVCKRTCLAFGHGLPVSIFVMEDEPFTMLM